MLLMQNFVCHKVKLQKMSVHFLWLVAIIRELVTRTEIFLEMLVYSPFNHQGSCQREKVLLNSVAVKTSDCKSSEDLFLINVFCKINLFRKDV